ncbi:MAG: hypothetical protein JRF28_08530 [Deltaproteobacteria bacterium]|nr:hypothetical protein [Deltaproteobacteria bacterium]MBW2318904.1 hypothetical protein [Deltaproteobacteria bacterium]
MFGLRIFDWNKLIKILAVFGLVVGAVFCSMVFSEDDSTEISCVSESCHLDMYNDDASSPYPHSPFIEKQCGECHLEADATSNSVSDVVSKVVIQPVVITCPDYLVEHTVVIKGLVPEAKFDINVTMQNKLGNKVIKQFNAIVPANEQDVRLNDERAPEISEVKAGPILRGVFLETTITWETDEVSTSAVEFGVSEQYDNITPEDGLLVKHHSVTVYGLEENKNYYFRVKSEDIFGNKGVSEDLEFSTGKVLSESDVELEDTDVGYGSEFNIRKAEIFVVGSDLGLYLEATVPTSLRVEYIKVEEPQGEELEQDWVTGTTDSEDVHDELRERKEWAIDACYRCHPPEELGLSHPVGIEPKDTTTIPEDLPMEDGVITCVTCHKPHGGDMKYFAQKEITKEICISCHLGY